MKRKDLKAEKLYTEREAVAASKMAIYQGIAMCLTALEWHYGWRTKRLHEFYDNVRAIAEMPPIFGKSPDALESMEHIKKTYGIDLTEIQLQMKNDEK